MGLMVQEEEVVPPTRRKIAMAIVVRAPGLEMDTVTMVRILGMGRTSIMIVPS